MKKALLTAALITIGMLTTENTNAQAHQGTPIEWTPASDVKTIPSGVQKSFNETVALAGLLLLDKPKWSRQNGLYTAHFRATGQYGPGSCALRFKPYGGLVLYGFDADNPPVFDWFE
jgi:hypothetical protein